jgi:purine-nucleoside phosphorylase
MSSPYDRKLGERALALARRADFVCHRGVYIAMLGPTYETRAEIRMLRYLGGDAVGMSTVPEAIVAAHAGLRVLGLSTITNVCSPDIPHIASGEAVVAMAETARDKLQAIVTGIIAEEFAA